jgi:cell division septal protein FtsQ
MHAHLPAARRAMLLSMIIGATLGLALSPACRIRQVTVTGPTEAVAADVAARLNLPAKANTVFLPLSHIRERTTECFRVKRLTVKRRSPQAIVISVHERQPMAALFTEDVGYTTIDGDGIPLVRTNSPGTLPVAKGVTKQAPELGRPIPDERLDALRACIEGARQESIDQNLRINLSDPYHITIHTADGVNGLLGDTRQLRRKTVIFARLLKSLEDEPGGVAYIDVSIENKPTFLRRSSNRSVPQ